MMEMIIISGMTWHECPKCGEKFYSKSDKCPYCPKKDEEKPLEVPQESKKKYPKKAFLVYKCPECGNPVVLKIKRTPAHFTHASMKIVILHVLWNPWISKSKRCIIQKI